MVVHYKPKFKRDIRTVKDKEVSQALICVVKNLQKAKNISTIQNLVKLEEYLVFYRIKIKLDNQRDYRLGICIRGNTVWLHRFLHRRKIYDLFP